MKITGILSDCNYSTDNILQILILFTDVFSFLFSNSHVISQLQVKIPSKVCKNMPRAAILESVSWVQNEPLIEILHFLRLSIYFNS